MIHVDCVAVRPRMSRTLLVAAKNLPKRSISVDMTKLRASSIGFYARNMTYLEHTDKWYQHQPSPVVENKRYKLLWDFSIQTDRVIEHRRPDIVIVDWEEKECIVIDVAIPADQNIADKDWEKISKYSELKLEITRLWNVKAKVIPIVVGALGSIPKNLKEHSKSLGLPGDIHCIQKSALLGTAGILRKVLSV